MPAAPHTPVLGRPLPTKPAGAPRKESRLAREGPWPPTGHVISTVGGEVEAERGHPGAGGPWCRGPGKGFLRWGDLSVLEGGRGLPEGRWLEAEGGMECWENRE